MNSKIISSGRIAAITAGLLVAVPAPALANAKKITGPNGATSFLIVTAAGKVCAAGTARTHGNGRGPIVGIKATKDGKGYWLIEKNGRTEAFGDAKQQKYRKVKLVKWTKPLGGCKTHVVSAAVVSVKAAKPAGGPPTKTTTTPTKTKTTTTATQTSATPAGGSSAPTATALAVSSSSLANGEVGVSYSQQLSATGGSAPYTWSVLSGSMPFGISSSGVFAGTPASGEAGSYTFTLQVRDANGDTASKTFTIALAAAPSVSTSTVAEGEANVTYSQQLSATGGSGSYTWAKASGTLPAGVTLSSSGALTGSPTTAGSYTFAVNATDSLGAISSAQTLTIAVATPVTLTTTSLPDPLAEPSSFDVDYSVAEVDYSQQLAISGGTGSGTFSVTGGSIPTGMNLSSSGLLTGDPLDAGPYSFTATVTDTAGGEASQTYSGLIAAWNNDAGIAAIWSGYLETAAAAYTSVSGTYTVPTLDSADPGGITSEWVGLDGSGNDYLIQAGTDAVGSTGTYDAWTQIITPSTNPDAPGTTISGFTVNAGDSITVSISETDPTTDAWTISLTDNTNAQNYTTTVTYDGPGAMAEWIVEAPVDDTGHSVGLAAWNGDIDFTNMTASQPASGLQYMTLAPYYNAGGDLNSLLTSTGFAVSDNEIFPSPLEP